MSKEWDALGVGHAYAPGHEPDPTVATILSLFQRLDGSIFVGLFVVASVFAILLVAFWPTPRARVRWDTPGSGAEVRDLPIRHRVVARGEAPPLEERRRREGRAR